MTDLESKSDEEIKNEIIKAIRQNKGEEDEIADPTPNADTLNSRG